MNKECELISVIMSVYKEPIQWVEKALNSIMNQTYSNIEIIVIIDNPDNKDVINFLKQSNSTNIKWLINEKNIGLVGSLNKALSLCSGTYIARMDADDYSYPTRIEKELKYLKSNNLDIVGSAYEIIENDRIIEKRVNPKKHQYIKRILKYKNCMVHPSWLVKSEVYKQLGGYRCIDACEDYDFLVRAIIKGYFLGNTSEVLFQYRINRESISHLKSLKQELTMHLIAYYYKMSQVMPMKVYSDYIDSISYRSDMRKLEKRKSIEARISNQKNLFTKIINIIYNMIVSNEFRKEKICNQIIKLIFFLDRY